MAPHETVDLIYGAYIVIDEDSFDLVLKAILKYYASEYNEIIRKTYAISSDDEDTYIDGHSDMVSTISNIPFELKQDIVTDLGRYPTIFLHVLPQGGGKFRFIFASTNTMVKLPSAMYHTFASSPKGSGAKLYETELYREIEEHVIEYCNDMAILNVYP